MLQPLLWAGLPASSGCPGPHPAWPWVPAGMGHHSFSGQLCQYLTALSMKNFLQKTSNINLPYSSLKPLPLVLSLSTNVKSWFPSWYFRREHTELDNHGSQAACVMLTINWHYLFYFFLYFRKGWCGSPMVKKKQQSSKMTSLSKSIKHSNGFKCMKLLHCWQNITQREGCYLILTYWLWLFLFLKKQFDISKKPNHIMVLQLNYWFYN